MNIVRALHLECAQSDARMKGNASVVDVFTASITSVNQVSGTLTQHLCTLSLVKCDLSVISLGNSGQHSIC